MTRRLPSRLKQAVRPVLVATFGVSISATRFSLARSQTTHMPVRLPAAGKLSMATRMPSCDSATPSLAGGLDGGGRTNRLSPVPTSKISARLGLAQVARVPSDEKLTTGRTRG